MTGVPLDPPGFGYIASQRPEPTPAPSIAAMLEATERARAEFDVQRQQLAAAIRLTAWCIGQTVRETEPVEQVAGREGTVRLLANAMKALSEEAVPERADRLQEWLAGLPVVVDESLPPSEVHLRPHPKPAGESS